MMLNEERKLRLQLLLLISRAEDEHKINRLSEKLKIPIYYQCYAQGSAPSALLDIWGLGGTRRLITICILPKAMIDPAFSAIDHALFIQKKGRGIALSIPITGMQNGIRKFLNEQNQHIDIRMKEGEAIQMKTESAYSLILTSVNHGFSNEVIDAARAAGAKGGTILRGRRSGLEEVMQFFQVTIQEEQDFVLIAVPQDIKHDVMTAITDQCGMKTKAKGIVLSLPIDDISGLQI